MKKTARAGELMWLLGMIFVALGVAICSKAELGVSMIAAPAFVVYDAIAPLWSGFSVGMTEYILQGLMLVLLCAVIRRFNVRYLLAFAVAVIYGYALNFFIYILGGVSPEALWLRWLMLIVGDVVTAFGVACFFRTYMPLQVYELFVAELSHHFGFDINRTKQIFDISLLVLSVGLALILFGGEDFGGIGEAVFRSYHGLGLGTLVTTAINSPLIALMGRLVDSLFETSPRFERLWRALRRN